MQIATWFTLGLSAWPNDRDATAQNKTTVTKQYSLMFFISRKLRRLVSTPKYKKCTYSVSLSEVISPLRKKKWLEELFREMDTASGEAGILCSFQSSMSISPGSV